jgi:hypothetical protein
MEDMTRQSSTTGGYDVEQEGMRMGNLRYV